MIGKTLENLDQLAEQKDSISKASSGQSLLEVRGVSASHKIEPFDLQLKAGEVMGFAGLLGSGRTEAARLLFGLDRTDTGSFRLGDKILKHMTPTQAIQNGLAFCPEDRKEDGVFGELTVRENIILALQTRLGWFQYLSRHEQNKIADQFIESLFIATPSPEQLVKNLSGGNQQKVILARWLAINPDILILDEPTRGIDIGTKTDIQKLVLDLAAENKSVVFISSELEEVLRCSHRIKVLRDHKMVDELAGDDLNGNAVMNAIAGS